MSLLLELVRPLSFVLSLLSLYPVMLSAFFEPGTRWQERLGRSLVRVAFAACVCFASGILYAMPAPRQSQPEAEPPAPLFSTLPVRLFFWTIGAMAILFAVSWYIVEYYIPLTDHGCCRP